LFPQTRLANTVILTAGPFGLFEIFSVGLRQYPET
jgi:hypothetical protein